MDDHETLVSDDGMLRVRLVRDDYPDNPREQHDTIGTMVRVRDGYGGMDIDQPDSDIAKAFEVAGDLIAMPGCGLYYVLLCGCYGSHDLEEVQAGECSMPYDAMLVGNEDDHYPDGSTWGMQVDLDSQALESDLWGYSGMLAAYLEATGWTDAYDLMEAFVRVGRADITGFMRWSTTGYCQGDWAEGYIYTTNEDLGDPIAALTAEVDEYDAWAKGDVYGIVVEKRVGTRTIVTDLETGTLLEDDTDEDWRELEAVWGYYGDEFAEKVAKERLEEYVAERVTERDAS